MEHWTRAKRIARKALSEIWSLGERARTRAMVPLRAQASFRAAPSIVSRFGASRATRLGDLLDWTPRKVVRRLYVPGAEVTVRFAGVEVRVRPGTSDVVALDDAFVGAYHRSPWPLRPIIVDLGSNIGLTLLDYALSYPDARLFGVELDEENAGYARLNTAQFSERCKVLTAGITTVSGPVTYAAPYGDPISFSLRDSGGPRREGRGLTLDDALLEVGIAGCDIDLLKIDIEGAEAEVLNAGGRWTANVKRLLVEIHAPWTIVECIEALKRHGFDAEPDARHWAAVRATRNLPS